MNSLFDSTVEGMDWRDLDLNLSDSDRVFVPV